MCVCVCVVESGRVWWSALRKMRRYFGFGKRINWDLDEEMERKRETTWQGEETSAKRKR